MSLLLEFILEILFYVFVVFGDKVMSDQPPAWLARPGRLLVARVSLILLWLSFSIGMVWLTGVVLDILVIQSLKPQFLTLFTLIVFVGISFFALRQTYHYGKSWLRQMKK